jgi:hypothetical protein
MHARMMMERKQALPVNTDVVAGSETDCKVGHAAT